MSEDDEWSMFGSDSDEDNTNDVHHHHDEITSKKEKHYETNTRPITTITTDTPVQRKDAGNSHGLHRSTMESNFEKAVSEVCLFVTKEFLRSNRSIPMSQRCFGTIQMMDNNNTIQGSEEAEVEAEAECKESWHNIFINKILQRNIQITTISSDDTGNGDKDGSSTTCSYSTDAGLMFCTFQGVDGSNNNDNDCTSQNTMDQRNESNLRKSIIPGGFLVLTMYIQYKNVHDTYLNERNVSKLISQWKINDQKIFHNSVWDIDNARFISQQANNNDGSEVITIYLMKRSCKVNTMSCPWKENKKQVPNAFYEERGNNRQLATEQIETWLQYERRILADATVSLSVAELKALENSTGFRRTIIMTKENLQKANHALKNHGFVIIPSLFSSSRNRKSIQTWSNAIMADFHKACEILKSSPEHNVDIFNPGKDGTFDPISYKEMAMREDLRVDLRDGPNIKKLRNQIRKLELEQLQHIGFYKCSSENLNDSDGTKPIIIDSNGPSSLQKNEQVDSKFTKNSINESDRNTTSNLRFDPNILEIVRTLLNPTHNSNSLGGTTNKIPLYKGNFGRYNFNGKGPNGLPQPLRISGIGSVISLPQAGDQAIHADTPHLFETHDCLPCHYCNLFILGDDGSKELCQKVDFDNNPTGENEVGGTAFIHGSHRLSVTAKLTEGDDDSTADVDSMAVSAAVREKARDEMHMRIIRPSLNLGDALLFDTRVLHFGLANQSKNKCRPMLYVNMTHSFFHDPKNWDDQRRIFD